MPLYFFFIDTLQLSNPVFYLLTHAIATMNNTAKRKSLNNIRFWSLFEPK